MRLLAFIGAAPIAAVAVAAAAQPRAVTEVYATWSVPARASASFAASCARGQTATGGMVVRAPETTQVLRSAPASVRSWRFRIANYGSEEAALTAVLTCANVRAATSAATFSFSRPGSHVFRVPCRAGFVPSGVGHDVTAGSRPQALPAVHLHFGSVRPLRHGWLVRAEPHGERVRMTIYGRCVRSLAVRRVDHGIAVPEGRRAVQRGCPRGLARLHAGHTAPTGIDVVSRPQRSGAVRFELANADPTTRRATLHLLCARPAR